MIPGLKKIISYFLIFGVFSSVFLIEKTWAMSCSEYFAPIYKTEKSVYRGGGFNVSSKGFRFNEINPILIQIADMFDTRYFDLLTERTSSSYIGHNVGITPREAIMFFPKVDDFLLSFVRLCNP